MATATITATNSGYVYKWATTYAPAHDAAEGTNVYNDNYASVGQGYVAGGTQHSVYRGGLIFDISEMGSGAFVTAATLSLMGKGDGSDTNFDITVVSGTDLADTLVLADYGDLLNDVTSLGSLTTVGYQLEDWNVITINALGLKTIRAALSSGVLRFGVKSSRDISITTPKLNGANAREWITFHGSDTSDKEPTLTITYSSGEGAGVLAIVEDRIHYFDAYGQERYFKGTAVP